MSIPDWCFFIPKYWVRHCSRDAVTGYQPQLALNLALQIKPITPSPLVLISKLSRGFLLSARPYFTASIELWRTIIIPRSTIYNLLSYSNPPSSTSFPSYSLHPLNHPLTSAVCSSSLCLFLNSFPFDPILLVSLPPTPGQSSSWGAGGLVPLESRNLGQLCVGVPCPLRLSPLLGVHPHQGELHA